jgi:hypothetical protein
MSQQNPDSIGSTGVAVEDKALDKESVIELLGEDEKEETLELEESAKAGKKDKQEKAGGEADEKPDKSEDDEEKAEELTLEDELEEELKEPDEEKLELIDPPSRRDMLAKYPNLFKDFPHLERSWYREQKYSEILPTIEDAQQAVEKATLLDNYEKEIYSGSTETLLATVRENDKEAYAKIVDNYLPTLYKVDQHSYYHTIGNVIKHTIISMVRDGKEQSNEELSTAAAVLNQYIFGTTKFTHPQNLSKEDVADESKEKEEKISQREKEFVERQFETAKDSLSNRVDNILKASVDKAIDPNESMTEFVKKVATREVLEGLEDLISRDTRFRGIYDKLWERAFENDFNQESMDRIKSAYLSKAKTLLPLLIKKARNEALRGTRKNAGDDNNQRDKKGPLPVGKTRTSTSLASGRANSNNNNKQIPKGMTSLEYLNQDD